MLVFVPLGLVALHDQQLASRELVTGLDFGIDSRRQYFAIADQRHYPVWSETGTGCGRRPHQAQQRLNCRREVRANMPDAKAVLLQEIARLGGDGGDLIDLAPQHRSQQRIVGRSLDEEHFELNGFA